MDILAGPLHMYGPESLEGILGELPTNSISGTWKLVGNANSQPPPDTFGIRICLFTSCPGIRCIHSEFKKHRSRGSPGAEERAWTWCWTDSALIRNHVCNNGGSQGAQSRAPFFPIKANANVRERKGQVGPKYHLGKLRSGNVALPGGIDVELHNEILSPCHGCYRLGVSPTAVPAGRGTACVGGSLARSGASENTGSLQTGYLPERRRAGGGATHAWFLLPNSANQTGHWWVRRQG